MRYLVFDIGVNFIKYALMTDNIEIIEKGNMRTPLNSLPDFVDCIGNVYDQYKNEVEGIAISMPGILNSRTGYVHEEGNLRYLKGISIIDVLKERCPVKIKVENDAKCAALAEVREGSLKCCKDAVVIILGTWVGGGIVINNKIFHGGNSFAGEFSYITTNPYEKNSYWGNKNGTIRLIDEFSKAKNIDRSKVNGEVFFEYVNAQDKETLKILDDFTYELAVQMINIQCLFDPEKIAIGGAISVQPFLMKSIIDNLNKVYNTFPIDIPRIEVVPCKYREGSNLVGSLYNYLTNEED